VHRDQDGGDIGARAPVEFGLDAGVVGRKISAMRLSRAAASSPAFPGTCVPSLWATIEPGASGGRLQSITSRE